MEPFIITLPNKQAVPIIVSVPHCGTRFPEEIIDQYDPALIKAPDDTDWFVDQLYDFAPSLGITMISAVYSRWVIDLNRDPESKPLYTDGRIITALCPATTFLGERIYKDKRKEVAKAEVDRRLAAYYRPYHQKIDELLTGLHAKFGHVLLWDCHSIRQVVPTIQKERFPDLILGDADEASASKALIAVALQNLRSGRYGVNHNHPFKGGYITRHFGNPLHGRHALQLEMCKVHYMDDEELAYDRARAESMREVLRSTLTGLAQKLTEV